MSLRELHLTRHLFRIQETFGKAGLPFTLLKGPGLSWLLYRDVAKRRFNDLDILIDVKHLIASMELLESMGYQPYQSFRPAQKKMLHRFYKDWGFWHEDGVFLELHWRLMVEGMVRQNRWFAQAPKPEFETICIQKKDFRIFRKDLHYPLYLLMHGSKHMWERAAWLDEFSLYLQRQKLDPEFSMEATRAGCARMWAYALHCTQRDSDYTLDSKQLQFLRRWSSPARLRSLDKLVAQAQNAYHKDQNFWTLLYRRLCYFSLMSDRIRDFAIFVLYMIFHPKREEMAALHLPRVWMYFIARPVSLIAKRFRRGKAK